ncbi:MAG TPA: AAC(3) family N-acetyltransferase [Bacteroidales bacterium]|nr:AAC(3) family N-acetyltransferase [Bacteroidales bacterium]HPS17656.1 AAC(3) family N-acetyltransferase [Bacteroidales bacterium]
MEEIKLFQTIKNEWVSNHDILKALEQCDAHRCKILYIHTGLSFGIPNPALHKNDILQILYQTIQELKVPTICVPTFTFSFCNGMDFDLRKSKSKMGSLNEFIRKQPEAVRSVDPLMSVAMVGEDKDIATGIGHESIGENSTFSKLHFRKDVRFLFLGVRLGDCFTYMHFIEKFLNVDYRYDMDFTGKITIDDKTYTDTFKLFVRFRNILPGKGSYVYEDMLLENKMAKRALCGNSFISSVEEPPAFELYKKLIEKDPNYFIDPKSVFDQDKTFEVKDMVAL